MNAGNEIDDIGKPRKAHPAPWQRLPGLRQWWTGKGWLFAATAARWHRGSFTKIPFTINGIQRVSVRFEPLLPGYSSIHQSAFHLRYFVRFTQSGMEFFIVAWHILGTVLLECSVPLRWAHFHNQLLRFYTFFTTCVPALHKSVKLSLQSHQLASWMRLQSEGDAGNIRLNEALLQPEAQSFAKNFGLYGHLAASIGWLFLDLLHPWHCQKPSTPFNYITIHLEREL